MKVRYRQHVQAKVGLLETRTHAKMVAAVEHTINSAQFISGENEAPREVRRALTDYRNSNEVLAVKSMDRKKAFFLNQRLAGSGFAWAVKTGY